MITRFNSFLLLFLLAGTTVFGQKSPKTSKPNVIFILVDDLGYGDLGSFFQNQRKQKGDKSEPWLLTPNLDKMAAEGAMLPEHYCAAPVCAPSRASIVLGVSQGHANVRDSQFDKALEDNYTLANMLKKAGYATAAIGKWGLQGKSKTSQWPAHPSKRGFDYYYGYIAHGDGHEHYPKEGLYRGAKKVLENYTDVTAGLDKCYTGDLFTAKAKKYIVDHTKGKTAAQPFFMYLSYDTPHAVLELATQTYPAGGGLKGGLQWLGQPGKMINTASGKIDSYMHPDYANATYDDDKNPSTPEVAWPDTYKRYACVNRRIDDQVGDILQLLKDLKIDKNTIVVFTSDNGPSKESYLPKTFAQYHPTFFNNFGPFDGIKRDVLEGGVRVSTLAHWPGTIKPNTVVKTPSISYDWMPTLAEAAGMPAPVRSDGTSLIPSLTGKGKQTPSNIYVEFFEKATTPDYAEFLPVHHDKVRKQMQMLRFGDTVGVRYNIQSAADDFEIYDVVKDPQQSKNLAKDNGQLQQLMKERALQSRRPDSAAARPYDAALVPAVKASGAKPGLKWKSYQVKTSWIPQTGGLKPVSVSQVAAPKAAAASGTNLSVFEGYINVPADGEYTFYMAAAGKAFLRIHDAAVIDEDFKNNGLQKGKMLLKAGYHPVKVYYMQTEAAKKPSLSLEWSAAGKAKAAIPASAFFN
jgi:arylsulfatase A-like enzyme